MSRARDIFLAVIEDALNYSGMFARAENGAVSYAKDLILRLPPDFSFDLSATGFSDQKWKDLVHAYLEPRGFEKFLVDARRKARPFKEVGYSCPPSLTHSNCIIGFTFNRERLNVFSRTCLLVPTGLLDLTLITVIARLVGAPVIHWHIGCARLTELKSTASLRAMGMSGAFTRRNAVRTNGYGSKRAASFLRRGHRDYAVDTPLPDVLTHLRDFKPREDLLAETITPDSLAALAGVRGLDIRNFLRDELNMMKYANYYGDRNAYRWFSYSDPIVKAVMARFDIKPPR